MPRKDPDRFIDELEMFVSDLRREIDLLDEMTCALERIYKIEGEPKSKEIVLPVLDMLARGIINNRGEGYYDYEHLRDFRKIIGITWI